jgi:hypothetical protein
MVSASHSQPCHASLSSVYTCAGVPPVPGVGDLQHDFARSARHYKARLRYLPSYCARVLLLWRLTHCALLLVLLPGHDLLSNLEAVAAQDLQCKATENIQSSTDTHLLLVVPLELQHAHERANRKELACTGTRSIRLGDANFIDGKAYILRYYQRLHRRSTISRYLSITMQGLRSAQTTRYQHVVCQHPDDQPPAGVRMCPQRSDMKGSQIGRLSSASSLKWRATCKHDIS